MPNKKNQPRKKTTGGFVCSCCSVIYNSQKGNFFSTKSELYKGNNNYITICRNCADEYFKKLIGFFNGDVEKAIKRCCQIFDWPYSERLLAATKDITSETSRIAQYPSKMNMAQYQAIGDSYLDTINIITSPAFESVGEQQEGLVEDCEYKDYIADKEVIRFFGAGHENLDYKFLQEEYDEWVAQNIDEFTKEQKEIVKNICIAQLILRKVTLGGDIKEIASATKTLQDLMKTGGFKPKEKKEVLGDQALLGMLAKKIESERPIAKKLPEYEDVDGIEREIKTFFLGHFCNLVHEEIPDKEMYEGEIERYSVKVPTAKDVADE